MRSPIDHGQRLQRYRRFYASPQTRGPLIVIRSAGDPHLPPIDLRPVRDIDYLVRQLGHTPVDPEVTPDEVRDHIAELKRGRFILKASCADRQKAAEPVAFVRAHSDVN